MSATRHSTSHPFQQSPIPPGRSFTRPLFHQPVTPAARHFIRPSRYQPATQRQYAPLPSDILAAGTSLSEKDIYFNTGCLQQPYQAIAPLFFQKSLHFHLFFLKRCPHSKGQEASPNASLVIEPWSSTVFLSRPLRYGLFESNNATILKVTPVKHRTKTIDFYIRNFERFQSVI